MSYYLIGEYFFEKHRNSVRGEIGLRERIKSIKQLFPEAELRVIYGEDISDRMIVEEKKQK